MNREHSGDAGTYGNDGYTGLTMRPEIKDDQSLPGIVTVPMRVTAPPETTVARVRLGLVY